MREFGLVLCSQLRSTWGIGDTILDINEVFMGIRKEVVTIMLINFHL